MPPVININLQLDPPPYNTSTLTLRIANLTVVSGDAEDAAAADPIDAARDDPGAMKFTIAVLLVYSLVGTLGMLILRIRQSTTKGQFKQKDAKDANQYLKYREKLDAQCEKAKLLVETNRVLNHIKALERQKSLSDSRSNPSTANFSESLSASSVFPFPPSSPLKGQKEASRGTATTSSAAPSRGVQNNPSNWIAEINFSSADGPELSKQTVSLLSTKGGMGSNPGTSKHHQHHHRGPHQQQQGHGSQKYNTPPHSFKSPSPLLSSPLLEAAALSLTPLAVVGDGGDGGDVHSPSCSHIQEEKTSQVTYTDGGSGENRPGTDQGETSDGNFAGACSVNTGTHNNNNSKEEHFIAPLARMESSIDMV